MAKPDGRIEKGQRLSTAISARAWNRAQDAADIVLGVRPSVTAAEFKSAVTYITADVLLDAHQLAFPHAGVAIELKYRPGFVNPDAASGWPDSPRHIGAEFLLGFIAPMNSVLANSAASANPRAVAISVEPLALGQRVVRCAIAGVVTAYVRVLNNNHTYAQVRQLRYSGEPTEAGLLESSTSGLIRICTGGVSLPNSGSIYPLPVLL